MKINISKYVHVSMSTKMGPDKTHAFLQENESCSWNMGQN